MATLIRVLLTTSFLAIPPANHAWDQAPAVLATACGKVQKVTCDSHEPHFTTIELKPKSKGLPVTILSADRSQFKPAPEELYRDTDVCASGRVELYKGHRRLVVTGPQDITIRQQLKPRRPGPWMGDFSRDCDEGVVIPVLVKDVKPNYTRAAMDERITGIVGLQAVVDQDGGIAQVWITQSLDTRYGLDEEAIRAVRQWRFTPGTRFGAPAPVLVDIEMSFRLK